MTVDPGLEDAIAGANDGLKAAFETWSDAAAGLPRVTLRSGTPDKVGYSLKGPNQNTVRYAAKGGPDVGGTLATTVRTYDNKTMALLDADVIINGKHRYRSLEAALPEQKNGPVVYDLQSVLTHELGHFHGLEENLSDHEATMYFVTQPGEIHKRWLTDVDRTDIATLYETEASMDQPGCGSATVAGHGGPSTQWLVFGLGLGVLWLRRTRLTAPRTLTLTAAFIVIAVPALGDEVATSTTRVLAEQEVWVDEVSARWEDGLIVSELSFIAGPCRGSMADCGALPGSLRARGGTVGELTQHVGHGSVPVPGQALELQLLDVPETGRTLRVAPK